MPKFPFEKKIIFLFSTIFIMVITAGIFSIRSNQTAKETDGLVRHTRDVLEVSGDLFSKVLDIETGVRGFIISGDYEFLTPYYQASHDIWKILSRLQRLVEGNSLQKNRVNLLRKVISEKIAYSARIIKLRELGGFEAARLLTITKTGKVYMDRIRVQIKNLEMEENRLLTLGQRSNLQSRVHFNFSFLFLLVSTLVLLCIVFFTTRHNLNERSNSILQLAESEEKFRMVLESAKIGVWDLNLKTGSSWRSAKHDELFGYSELVKDGTYESFNEHIVPEDRERARASFDEALAGGNYKMECRIKRVDDGTIRWITAQGQLYKNERGESIKLMGTITDITQRKEQEKELIEQAERLKAANEELETFSYSVSHDLRAPLRSLEGFSKTLLENYKGRFDEDADRWLNYIMKNANKMGVLINDMLAFSKVTRSQVSRSMVNMTSLAKDIVETEKSKYPQKTVNIYLNELPPGYGDKAMIAQVWQNLVSNAFKYSSLKEEIKITITGKKEEKNTVYTVKDEGQGFDQKYEKKLFGVFQRLHSDAEFEGTGVGLAIVQQIIKKHDGTIEARGYLGRGAEFTFTLPLS